MARFTPLVTMLDDLQTLGLFTARFVRLLSESWLAIVLYMLDGVKDGKTLRRSFDPALAHREEPALGA